MLAFDMGHYSACLLAAKTEMLSPKHSVRSERPDPAKTPVLLQKGLFLFQLPYFHCYYLCYRIPAFDT